MVPVPGNRAGAAGGTAAYAAVPSRGLRRRGGGDGPIVGVEPRRRVAGHAGTKVFRRNISGPKHFIPTAEGFGAAVRVGLGWGMFAEQLVADEVAAGSLKRVSDAHLDVPLFWQCWKLDSPMVDAITSAVRAAASSLREVRT